MPHKFNSKMKKVAFFATIIFLTGIVISNAYTSPGNPRGFVNDFANIINSQEELSLNQILSDFKDETTIEVAVVTITSLENETIETYAVKLFEEWGIGNEEKDNGVLFLIAPNDREVRIEVGYGLEGVLTDAQSNGIIQEIVLPDFRVGDFQLGILKGSQAIVDVVKSEADYSYVVVRNDSFDWSQLIYIAWFFIIILGSILAHSKSWWLGGVLGGLGGIVIGFIFGFIFTGIISIIALTVIGLIFDYIVSKGGKKGFWPMFFGGGGHGGSGGFGGFGGGMSGGGGASGRW